MDINKLSNHTNGHIEGTNSTGNGERISKSGPAKPKEEVSDKISLDKFNFRNNEKLYGKVELEKLNQRSFDRLKTMKAKLSAYEEAKAQSPETAAETEIGKMINDSGVWSEIAQKIID